MNRSARLIASAFALLMPVLVLAKPIAFADGTTIMAEYGAGTMEEVQVFYAPRFDLSLGGGHIEFDSAESRESERITYARVNYLMHRWNQESAQGNVFVWGGAGTATGNTFSGSELAGNAGAQADYETRRIYASMKTDWQGGRDFRHRVDTLQLGAAPYAHRYTGVATWFLLQLRDYTGGIRRGVEKAALVRVFKGGAWLEAGVTRDGHLQAMAMFNF